MRKLIKILFCLCFILLCTNAIADVPIDEEHFPDPAFRDYVFRMTDTNQNHILDEGEIANVISIDCSGLGIHTVKGVQYFKNLSVLFCNFNQLNELDLSNLQELYWVMCLENQLTNVNISGCISLDTFQAMNNQIISIDVSTNPELCNLQVDRNQLTSIDVSKNPLLKMLTCAENQLTSIDISHNPSLKLFLCASNHLVSLDVSSHNSLQQLSCDNNRINELILTDCPNLQNLSCGFNELNDLDVSHFPLLQNLHCPSNALSYIDLSGNPELLNLHISDNPIAALDLRYNAAIVNLHCAFTGLTSLNVSHLEKLEWLECNNNKLTALDVSHNPALSILNCGCNDLKTLDVSSNTELQELKCSNSELDKLDVSNNPLLIKLDCNLNNLASLDVSNNQKLTNLWCYANPFINLDISNCPNLCWLIENRERKPEALNIESFYDEEQDLWLRITDYMRVIAGSIISEPTVTTENYPEQTTEPEHEPVMDPEPAVEPEHSGEPESEMYTVTFNSNGGTGKMKAILVEKGKKLTLPECEFTAPKGKEFSKWDKGAKGKKIKITKNMEITAVWKDIKLTVTFDAGSGTGTMKAVKVVYGNEYTLPKCTLTAPTGKIFSSWDKGAPGKKIKVTKNLVIKAKWKNIPVKRDYNFFAKMVSVGKTSLKLSWENVSKAEGYEIWLAESGSLDYQKYGDIPATKLSFIAKKLEKNTVYKGYVRAYRKNRNNKVYIGNNTPTVYAFTGGSNNTTTNPSSMTVKKSEVKLNLEKSKQYTVKATVKGLKSGLLVLDHGGLLRYFSSNANIAKVNSNGVITAVNPGTCAIYVMTCNGIRTKVDVTVSR